MTDKTIVAAVEDAGRERPHIGPNELEAMAKARPDEYFLKGSGVLKLLQGIRTLEADLRAALAGGSPGAIPSPPRAVS